MAKSWAIEGLSTDQSLFERARLIITTKFREAFHFQPGVLLNDVEAVHDMRVSLRRLWAALQGFQELFLATEELDKLTQRTRKLASKLGKVRDTDVLMELVEKNLAKEPSEITDPLDQSETLATKLTQYFHKRRAKYQLELVKYLEKVAKTDFQTTFLDYFAQTSPNPSAQADNKLFLTPLDLFYAEAPKDNSIEPETLHELRIAAKRLRYSLEFFEICYRRRLSSYIGLVRDLQELLGDLHDCDVMLEFLNRRKEKWQLTSDSPLLAELEALIAKFISKREQLAHDFLALWQKDFQSGFRTRLKRILIPKPSQACRS